MTLSVFKTSYHVLLLHVISHYLDMKAEDFNSQFGPSKSFAKKFRHALSAPEWRTYLEHQESLKKRSLMEKKRKHLESIEKKKKKKEEEEKTKKQKLLREEEKKKKDEVKEKQLEEKRIRKMEKLEEERTKKN